MPVDYDSLAKQLGGASEEDDFDRLAKGMGGAVVPQIGQVPDLKAVHAANQAAEAQKFGESQSGTAKASALLRGAGGLASMVPIAGPFLAGIGETGAQAVEMAGGQRQEWNPARTALEMGVGLIPGGKLASGLVKPTTGIVRSFGKAAAVTGAHALEGAARGAGTTAATSLVEGQIPSAEEVGAGAIGGAVLSPLTAAMDIHQMRSATKVAGAMDKAHNQIYAAIKPEASDTREFSEHLNNALPYIYANRKGNVNSISDMEQAAKGTMRRLWDLHIEPVVAMNSHAQVDTAGIAQSLRSRVNRDTPKSVRKAIEEEASKFDQPRTLGELSRILKETNAKTRGLQEASGKSARTLRTDPKTGWRFEQLDALRGALADEAGKITGSPDMYMKLRKDWGSLSEVAESAGEAAKRWEHQKKLEAASLVPGLQRTTKAVMGGLGFGGTAAIRRGAAEIATEYMANPDRQIKGAFKRLRFSQRMGTNFPEPPDMPERKLLPAMGETGEPSIADLAHIKPTKKARKQLTSGFEGGTATPEVIEGRASHYGQPTSTFEAAEQFRKLPYITDVPQQRMLPPASGQTVQPTSGEKIITPASAQQPTSFRPQQVMIQSGQVGTVENVRGDYSGVRLGTGELVWQPTRTLQVQPARYAGPVQGQTVPITVGPVPNPPPVIGQVPNPHLGIERRQTPTPNFTPERRDLTAGLEQQAGFTAAQQAAANPAVAQRAVQLHDAISSATKVNPAYGALEELEKLAQQYDWIGDYIAYGRNPVKRGGTRGAP